METQAAFHRYGSYCSRGMTSEQTAIAKASHYCARKDGDMITMLAPALDAFERGSPSGLHIER